MAKLLQINAKILEGVSDFYANLFRTRDHELSDINLDQLLEGTNQYKLSAFQSNSIEGLLTLSEITESLKNMKNNKTPGIDGFPADFFKFFWNRLKYFVLRSLNYSYTEGILPITLRQCIISCLPKGEKPRQYLKNWRPISLLCVVYKIASAAISNRLKRVLDKLIDNVQSGFLNNRYIGDSTRLIYDIMSYCENNKQDGMLMLIDFEKAFDSVSWSFLYQVLRVFNFGDSVISWIKLFNHEVTASVLQCGVLSKIFPIQRGCRQGDPISAYLFITCVQIMYIMIIKNINIKGIFIKNHEYHLTQFADDTTLLLDGMEGALQAALNTIEVFGSFSGLRMNMDKTRIIWKGRKKYSKDKLNINHDVVWGETTFDLLGIKFNVNLKDMIDMNFNNAINQINNLLNHWNKRYLTPMGKSQLLKLSLSARLYTY